MKTDKNKEDRLDLHVMCINNIIIKVLDLTIRIFLIIKAVLIAYQQQYLQSYCVIIVYILVCLLKYACFDKLYQVKNDVYFKQICTKPILLDTLKHLDNESEDSAEWRINGGIYISNKPQIQNEKEKLT